MRFEAMEADRAGETIMKDAQSGKRNLLLAPVNPILSPYALAVFCLLGDLVRALAKHSREESPSRGSEGGNLSFSHLAHVRVRLLLMGSYTTVKEEQIEDGFPSLLREHLRGLLNQAGTALEGSSIDQIRHFVVYKSACFGTIANDILCSLLDAGNAPVIHPLAVQRFRCEDIVHCHDRIRREAKQEGSSSTQTDSQAAADSIADSARKNSKSSDLVLTTFSTPDNSNWTLLGRILDIAFAEARKANSSVFLLCDHWLEESAKLVYAGREPESDMVVRLVSPQSDPVHPESFPLPLFITPTSEQVVRAQIEGVDVSLYDKAIFCEIM